ncbi:ABC transporter ATP-binding protein [candidate division WOR-3 bacterium]|nr:ABC transporter ATP-binding protein [candidate division WOR-3 bacterium]
MTEARSQNCGQDPAVQARSLTRTYRRGAEKIKALKGIDLDIKCGEFVGVVGHSGAGKTTLLNLIGLMDRPTEGKLGVLGTDVTRRAVRLDALRRKNIGFVFQEFYLMPTLTATENVLLPTMWGKARDMTGSGSAIVDRVPSRDRAKKLLDLVGLGHRMTHKPSELSGGEMQRVAVARALVNSPRLLLADEPTGNLDTATRDGVFSLLLALNRDSGLTVIVATHDLGLESRFTRVVRLEDGAIVK